jgi:2-keto-3-deoxy-galactonokinase
VGVRAEVGPVGTIPTPVAEGEVLFVCGFHSKWGVLPKDRADRMFCTNMVKELFDH